MPDRVRETFLEVRVAGTGEVVTVVEVLSPANKRAGAGRRLYEEKRQEILGTRTSLVEVDLIRAGDPMPVIGNPPSTGYRILVSRGDRRPRAELFSFGVCEPIPIFRIPLRPGDSEPEVDVGAILRDLYERAAYDLSIDYGTDATPPLGEGERMWADGRLRAVGMR